jgi:type IV pilus assembly protein PilM
MKEYPMAAESPVGLDIGSMSIRAVETSRSKDGPVVTNFGRAVLPEGAVQAGVIADGRIVTAVLAQMWAATRFRSRKVVLGITNTQTVVREMDLPNLPDRELRKALPFQARDALPLAVERAVLDFHRLEEPGSGPTVRGLLIAAPKEPVLNAVHAIENARLHVSRVDLASFALLRANSRLDSTVEAVVDIGAAATTVVVHQDGTPLMVRTIPRGGAEVTESVAVRLDIATPAAESVKCQVGLLTDTNPEAAAAVADAIRPLMNEIRSSLAYLNTGERQSRVTRLVLSGGSAMLPGLVAALAARLKVEVVLADPTARLRRAAGHARQSLEPFHLSAAVSIGLTLGATP